MGTRLNKYIADSGLCSRRAADDLIDSKRVKVNNIVAMQGLSVEPGDIVLVDNKPIAKKQETVCLLVHKPVQVVSTVSDPEGRITVLDLLPARYKKFRLYPVGRLDYFSEGLIILTNDGDLANKLMHPKHDHERIYRVRVRNEENRDINRILNVMQQGMTLEDGTRLAPVETKVFPQRKGYEDEYDIEFVLHQGINRQIRRMCSEMDLTILRLMRISHGPFTLGNIPPSGIYELTAGELNKLKKQL